MPRVNRNEIFAVDVLSSAVMSNHLHVVARTRPDIVRDWSDEVVALRWWNLFPQRRRKDRSPEEPPAAGQIARRLRHNAPPQSPDWYNARTTRARP